MTAEGCCHLPNRLENIDHMPDIPPKVLLSPGDLGRTSFGPPESMPKMVLIDSSVFRAHSCDCQAHAQTDHATSVTVGRILCFAQRCMWPGDVVVRALAHDTKGCGFDSRPFHFQVTTSGKLFTHVPLSPSSMFWYQAVKGAVTPCGWEGNHRSGVALAMHHRLKWLWTHGLDREISTPPTFS